jgi:hypothetical protein
MLHLENNFISLKRKQGETKEARLAIQNGEIMMT